MNEVNNDRDQFQENLKVFITKEVNGTQRVFKIVDGTVYPMKKAHVFYEGETPDLGDGKHAYVKMGIAAIESTHYCEWIAKNRNTVAEFYEGKNMQ